MSKNNSEINLDEIVKMAMNNHGLIQQFIGLYIENLEEMKDRVPQYMMAGHIDSLRAAYHKNLPGLKIIGANKLIDELFDSEKENNDKERLKSAIKHIAHKNIKMIPEWKKENPNYSLDEGKTNDKYLKIVMQSMGGSDKTEDTLFQNKIISKIAKEVTIDKER
jgi:hypothetical protein